MLKNRLKPSLKFIMPIFGAIIKRALALKSRIPSSTLTPVQIQEQTLRRLLKRAHYTTFGKYFDFDTILDSEEILQEFASEVPIYDYDKMFDEWWHNNLKNKFDVTWPGKVNFIALSSGTSGGPSKYIPITHDMIKANRDTGKKMFYSFYNFHLDSNIYTKKMLMLGGSSDLEFQDGYYMGDLSGINLKHTPIWLKPSYKPGDKITRIKDWDEKLTAIAKEAPNWDIGYIMGIPSWLQLMVEKVIEYNNLETIHDIWPNFKVFIHGGVAFEPYRKSFDKLISKPIHYIDTYLASEGFIAFQKYPKSRAMSLVLNNGIYFEFIPFNKENFDADGELKNNVDVLNIGQIEEGIDYALLISTCAGAWRYLIGDTVRFTDKANAEILITGRTKHFLSICGEHVSIENMNDAVKCLEDEMDIEINEFTVAAIEKDGSFTHKWYVGTNKPCDAKSANYFIDEALKLNNADYATERKSVLRDIEVEIVPSEFFYKYLRKIGKYGGQAKFPRVMKAGKFKEWEAFVFEERQKLVL